MTRRPRPRASEATRSPAHQGKAKRALQGRAQQRPESSCRAEATGTSGLCQGPPDRSPEAPEQDGIWVCIEALCFGDFHLGQQMKVTRPPGRNPARPHAVKNQSRRQSAAAAKATVAATATAPSKGTLAQRRTSEQ